MYKVMTKLHTRKENVYAFYTVANDEGEQIEYEAETPEEAAETAISLLGRVGYEDLRIVDDKSYYIDLIYGKRPQPGPQFYTLQYVNISGYTPEQTIIENIEEGTTVSSLITFTFPEFITSFHLIVDGVEYSEGNPDWIEFSEIIEGQVTITYYNINQDHEIQIVIDGE